MNLKLKKMLLNESQSELLKCESIDLSKEELINYLHAIDTMLLYSSKCIKDLKDGADTLNNINELRCDLENAFESLL